MWYQSNDSDQSHEETYIDIVIDHSDISTRVKQPMTTETLELECRRELNGLPQDEDQRHSAREGATVMVTKLK